MASAVAQFPLKYAPLETHEQLLQQHTHAIKRVDQVPPAGKIWVKPNETAANCLIHDIKHVNDSRRHDRFRADHLRQPGLRYTHGISSEEHEKIVAQDAEYRHGIVGEYGEKAGDCFHQLPDSELQTFALEQTEKIYRSHVREPLGSSFVRGHKLPDAVQHPEFAFGQKTNLSESAKNMIYPIPSKNDEIRDNGLKPFERFVDKADAAVTRPIRRNYTWDKINPEQYRFGTQGETRPDSDAVASLLQWDNVASSKVVSLKVAAAREAKNDPVGRSKPSSGIIADLPPDYVFGSREQMDSITAADCIHSGYSVDEQLPDQDIGRSSRKLHDIHAVPENHIGRSFGLPSVRTDLKKPSRASLANFQAWGDESDAKSLVSPYHYAHLGVTEEDFIKERQPDELRHFFAAMGQSFSDEQFSQIISKARELNPVLSIDSFRHAINKS